MADLSDEELRRPAVISSDGRYRYWLSRRVDLFGDSLWVFVMLNPSTADATEDDPTIRRCMGFARREGFGRLGVVNLFAWRATKPADLAFVADPVGPENNAWLAATNRADLVVAAWGASAAPMLARYPLNDPILPTTWCLGRTKSGAPRHPLYVAATTPLELYEKVG